MIKLYRSFLWRLPITKVKTDQYLHLLNSEEIKYLRSRHNISLVIAAIFSVIGFLLYYLPTYWFPQLFPFIDIPIPFTSIVFPFQLTAFLWGILLMIIEIYLLVLLNLYGTHEIAVATGFLDNHNKEVKTDEVLTIGLNTKNKNVMKYGIDPFQGLSRWQLFLYNLFMQLKGWLSNTILRFLLQRLLGRFAIREILDFAGLPIYMFINAYSTHNVLREARVLIMGQNLIEAVCKRIRLEEEPNAVLNDLIYDTLQFIAISKRDYHQNHFLLTKNLVDLFQIPIKGEHDLPENYFDKMLNANHEHRQICEVILILGFLLDGALSVRERAKIKNLNEANVMNETFAEIRGYQKDFLNGVGIEKVMSKLDE